MTGSQTLVTATIVTATLLFSITAQAMEFERFDRLSKTEQAEYIAVLVDVTQKALRDEGQSDLAAKIEQLFATIKPGDSLSLGLVELEGNVARARVADVQRVEKDSAARRLDVEDALFVTLKKNDIVVTTNAATSILRALANFHRQPYAEFKAMSSSEKRRFITLLVTLGVPDWHFRDQLGSKDKPLDWRDITTVINTKFLNSSVNQPGFAEVAGRIDAASRSSPNVGSTFIALLEYVLDQDEEQLRKRENEIDSRAVVIKPKLPPK